MKKFVVMVFAGMLSVAWSMVVFAGEPEVTLKEIVVTATKTEKSPQDVTQSVTVITADEIRKSGASNAAEAVRSAVAVMPLEYGPRGALSQLSLRGSSSAQVLVLLDGKRLNSPRTGGFSMTDLPVTLDEIDRIEIVRGPSSALYGADAVGGVVHIITKRPDQGRTNVKGTVGSHGFDSISAGNSGKIDNWFYALNAGRETSDGYRQNSDLDQWTAGGKIGYEIAEHSSLELTMNSIDKENGVPGSTQYSSPRARQGTKGIVAGLGYRVEVSKELGLKLNTFYNGEKVAYTNPDAFPPDDTRQKSVSTGSDLQVNWLANSWNLITAGVEAKGDRMASSAAGDHAARLSAGYFQDEISAGESFLLIVGGRYDNHSIYGDKFSPKTSARYLFAHTGTIIRASAGRSFRAPTFYDLYWPYSSSTFFGTTYITDGNPDLKPEKAVEYEGSVEQPFGTVSTVSVRGFERRVENLIDWVESQPTPTTFMYTPKNIGKARIRGGEAEARLRVAETVAFAVSYTYMNPVDTTTGTKIYYTIPKTQLKGSANLTLFAKTNVYVEGRMVDNYVKPGEARWKYAVMDSKITQAISISSGVNGEVFIGMNNVFDRKYETVRYYPMPPREIYGGVTVQF